MRCSFGLRANGYIDLSVANIRHLLYFVMRLLALPSTARVTSANETPEIFFNKIRNIFLGCMENDCIFAFGFA